MNTVLTPDTPAELTLSHNLLTVDEEELQEMKDDEERVESIEVDVKCVAPLHVEVFARMFQEVLVADDPGTDGTGRIFYRTSFTHR